MPLEVPSLLLGHSGLMMGRYRNLLPLGLRIARFRIKSLLLFGLYCRLCRMLQRLSVSIVVGAEKVLTDENYFGA